MTVPTLLAAFVAVASCFVYVCATTQPAPEPAGRHRLAITAQPHRPLMGQPAPKLPRRQPGKAALKAVIKTETMLTPVERTPKLRIRKQHPDWAWDTDTHRQVWDSWFDGQPADQAVMLVEVR